jgi:hypothetical protein
MKQTPLQKNGKNSVPEIEGELQGKLPGEEGKLPGVLRREKNSCMDDELNGPYLTARRRLVWKKLARL